MHVPLSRAAAAREQGDPIENPDGRPSPNRLYPATALSLFSGPAGLPVARQRRGLEASSLASGARVARESNDPAGQFKRRNMNGWFNATMPIYAVEALRADGTSLPPSKEDIINAALSNDTRRIAIVGTFTHIEATGASPRLGVEDAIDRLGAMLTLYGKHITYVTGNAASTRIEIEKLCDGTRPTERHGHVTRDTSGSANQLPPVSDMSSSPAAYGPALDLIITVENKSLAA